MSVTDPIVLDDLEPVEVPVSFKLNGQAFRYVLTEASEDAYCKWRNYQIAATKFVDGKAAGWTNMADSKPLLVSLCLYAPGPDGKIRRGPDGNPLPADQVKLAAVRGWPTKIVTPLFVRAKDISGLNEEETEESLLKQRAEIDEKLAALGKEDPAKNSSAAGESNSSSPSDSGDSSTS